MILRQRDEGIGSGSLLCNRLLGGKVSARIVPWGAVGIGLFSIDLWLASPVPVAAEALVGLGPFLGDPGRWRILLDLFGIAVSGGVFVVPLYALLQAASEPQRRAQTIAANNVINAAAMVVASVATMGLLAAGVSVAALFLLTGSLTLAVALLLWRSLPRFAFGVGLSETPYRLSAWPGAEECPRQASGQLHAFADRGADFPPDRRRRHPGPTRDLQPSETEQQRGAQQVDPVADQHDRTRPPRAQQPHGLVCVLDGVARSGLDQKRRLRHTASERHPAHDFGFRHRSVTAAREQQQRRDTPLKESNAAIESPCQSCRGAAAEHNDRIGYRIRRSLPLTPALSPRAGRGKDPRGGRVRGIASGQASAVIASAPLIRAASAAARKRSISPSSTAPVFPVSTPVRRSFTI
jgi:hypothetical protein